jgi:SAM-dependent methyltransferase
VNGVPAPLLVSAVAGIPAGRALDLACGTGRHAIYLAQHGWTVTAVDSAREAIGQLRERSGPAVYSSLPFAWWSEFAGWGLLHYAESKRQADSRRVAASRPMTGMAIPTNAQIRPVRNENGWA